MSQIPPSILGRAPEQPASAAQPRGLFFIWAAVAFVGVSLALQMGLNANFLAEDIGIEPVQIGHLEAVRESCGVLALGVLALLAGMAEPLIGAAMLALLAVGISAFTHVHSFTWVVLMSLVWSQGLHVWMPLPASMTLSLAEPGRAGHRLGQTQAAGAVGFGSGLLLALGLSSLLGVGMRPMYTIAGVTALAAAAACLAIPRQIKAHRPRLVFRRRYSLYYALCLLEGWRKQITISFAGFLLVKVHHTPLQRMLIMMIAVQVAGYFASPAVGRLIDKIGERRVLLFYYICLIAFFIAYALIPDPRVLYGIYIADSAFFVFAMALTTYANRIAPSGDLTPTLSMGVAMNHVAAVVMPLICGTLWQMYDFRWPFYTGAAAALVSIVLALRLPRLARAKEPAHAEAL